VTVIQCPAACVPSTGSLLCIPHQKEMSSKRNLRKVPQKINKTHTNQGPEPHIHGHYVQPPEIPQLPTIRCTSTHCMHLKSHFTHYLKPTPLTAVINHCVALKIPPKLLHALDMHHQRCQAAQIVGTEPAGLTL
jgi:hypothetical protein